MTAILRNLTGRNLTVFSLVLTGLLLLSFGPASAQSKTSGGSSSGGANADGNTPLTTSQLSSEFQALSADDKAALLKQLAAIGSGPITMEKATQAFYNLPPALQKKIDKKWDSLSDEQRIALKKMNAASLQQIVGQMVGQMAGQKVQEAMAPVTKAVDKAKAVVEDAKTVAQKARAYVQGLLGKFFGSGSSQPNP